MATIIGKPGNDILTGTNNNDLIDGNGGIDYIDAKGGNDTITGAGTIIGGKGNDYINLTDDSTVIFNLGDGIDTINNIYLAQSTTIVFGNTIKTNMVTMQQFGSDLIIRIGNNDDQIIVKDYFSNNDYKNLPYRLKFADGTVWISNGINPINTNKIVDHIPQTVGTIPPTQILKNNKWNFTTDGYFTDKDSGDKLTYSATLADGSALPNWLTFDANTGKFSGTPPNTTGKPIDYTIIITATDKYNESISQTLKLTVSPFSFINNGTTGNDTITGTADDDSIQGGYGDDSIIAGAGNDLIYGDTNKIDPKNKGNNYIDAGAGKNTVYGGIGNDEIIAGNEDNLIYGDLENSNKYYGDDSITVGDGKNVIYGGGGNDTIIAGNGNNTIYGDFNNNKINLGDNQIQVGDGNNTIYGGAGNDTIIAGNGHNQIIDNYGQNSITTGNGNDTITGTGTITAGKGNDSITINVAGSQDTVIFNIGDGKDIINSLDTSKNKAVDTIKFGVGITKSDISFSTSGKDLIVIVGSTGDQITLKNFFAGENYQTLRRFEFADGSTWEDVRTEVTFTLTGTVGNDKITGTPWNDIIHGGLGNDVITDISGDNQLYGDEGNDNITGRGTLIGGTGNDTLTANVAGSSDTFIFDRGDGTDIINSIDAAKVGEKGSDTLEIHGYNQADMTTRRVGNNLVIILGGEGSGDQITLVNYFAGANYQTLNTIVFDDQTWTIQGNLTLEGTDKNDKITGSQWNDTINGGLGNDVIVDTLGDNELNGGEGNDNITGRGTLIGGTGNDTLTANVAGSSDTFIFDKGDGTDIINSIDAAKVGEKGSDTLEIHGYNQADMTTRRVGNNLVIILGGEGSGDQITINNYFASANYQTLNTIVFDDQTWTIQGNLTLEGTDKNDKITGSQWNDTINGGLGNDVIVDTLGDNELNGGEGNDNITGRGTLIGGTGNDTLTANVAGSSDTFIFDRGDGTDIINSIDAAKVGEKGSDTLEIHGYNQADMTTRRVGNNLVIILGGEGSGDQITLVNYFASANYQTLNTIVFDDQTWTIQGNLTLEGTDKNDKITGSQWNDTINGGLGNDVIVDTLGDNELNGGEGNDNITGRGTLIGGTGNDTLTANVAGSSDTFIFDKGDGTDIINSIDAAKVGEKGSDTLEIHGYNQADMTTRRVGNNLVIILGGEGSGDQITINNYFASANYQTLNTIVFDDQTWTIQGNLTLEGTDKNDKITGSQWNDTINGGLGNDVIVDTLGDNELNGGEGNDNITGRGTLIGGTGNDTLTANVAGSSDTFIFDKGDGTDIINSIDAAKVGEKGSDTLEIHGYNQADMTTRRVGNNLVIILGGEGSGDQITINNYFASANYQTLNTIVFDDQTWTIQGNLTLEGTDKNDKITGSQWNDTINGGLGNDVIVDTLGDNELNGGEGNDNITGRGTLIGGTGNDTLTANVAGSSDTFIFDRGDGTDIINSIDAAKVGEKGSDTLEIHGYNQADMTTRRVGNNLVIILGGEGSGDQITLVNYFASANYQTLNTIVFDDQTWTIQGNLTLEGTDKNDKITGSQWNDTINGGLGNDVIVDTLGDNELNGGEGNDNITGRGTLIGGTGNDTLTANVAGSSDTFIFDRGDGTDIINSIDAAKVGEKGSDTLEIHGYNQADMTTRRVGNNLVIILGGEGSGDQITLVNYFASANYQTLNTIVFDDQTWTIQGNLTLEGTDKNDKITGSQWNDTINGGLGNDVIVDTLGDNELNGGEGNDNITGRGTLIGGTGNDTLTANVAGSSDTFIFDRGDGTDIINSIDTAKVGEKGSDIIAFGNGITTDMIDYERKGNNLVITIGSSDQITINNYFKGANYQTIEKFTFKDGSIWELNPNGTNGFEITKNPPSSGGDAIGFSTMLTASIENQTNGLIDAMASFAPSVSAHTRVEDKPLDINSVLIATNIN